MHVEIRPDRVSAHAPAWVYKASHHESPFLSRATNTLWRWRYGAVFKPSSRVHTHPRRSSRCLMQPHRTTTNNLTSGYTETINFSFNVFTVLCFSCLFLLFASIYMIFLLHSLTRTTCYRLGQKQDYRVPGRRKLFGKDKSH